jgi:parvulin-like peptidyl-prolyl isomerase
MKGLLSGTLLWLLASAGSAAVPAAAPVLVEDTVATVNGTGIMLSDYKKEESSTIAYLRRTNPAALADADLMRKIRENTLEELITRELLLQEGKRAQLTVTEHDIDDAVQEIKDRFKEDPETGRARDDAQAEQAFTDKLKADGVDFNQYRQSLTGDIMARKVISLDVLEKTPPPTDSETRAYFDKVEAYLASKSTAAPAGMGPEDAAALREAAVQVKALSSEGVRLERILVRVSVPPSENELKRALKTAQQIKKRLDEGEDFGKLAREESEDPESAARGGDIGFVVRGISEPELEKLAFSMEVGRISDPIQTEIGYNIVRIKERRAARAPEYDRFRDDLMTFLGGLAKKKRLESYLKDLRAKAVIERRLPSAP